VEDLQQQNRPKRCKNGLLVVVEQLGAIMLTILLTAVILAAFYIALAVVALRCWGGACGGIPTRGGL
jgi:hypothetical protein